MAFVDFVHSLKEVFKEIKKDKLSRSDIRTGTQDAFVFDNDKKLDLRDNGVGGENLKDLAISTAKIDNGVVTEAKLANNAVTEAKLATSEKSTTIINKIKADIQDNLTSTDTDKPLSAHQGKVLNEKINASTNAPDGVTIEANRASKLQLKDGGVTYDKLALSTKEYLETIKVVNFTKTQATTPLKANHKYFLSITKDGKMADTLSLPTGVKTGDFIELTFSGWDDAGATAWTIGSTNFGKDDYKDKRIKLVYDSTTTAWNPEIILDYVGKETGKGLSSNDFTTAKQLDLSTLKTEAVRKANIVDNVTSTVTDQPLSANQGKVLKALIDDKVTKDGSKVLSDNNFDSASKNQITSNEADITTIKSEYAKKDSSNLTDIVDWRNKLGINHTAGSDDIKVYEKGDISVNFTSSVTAAIEDFTDYASAKGFRWKIKETAGNKYYGIDTLTLSSATSAVLDSNGYTTFLIGIFLEKGKDAFSTSPQLDKTGHYVFHYLPNDWIAIKAGVGTLQTNSLSAEIVSLNTGAVNREFTTDGKDYDRALIIKAVLKKDSAGHVNVALRSSYQVFLQQYANGKTYYGRPMIIESLKGIHGLSANHLFPDSRTVTVDNVAGLPKAVKDIGTYYNVGDWDFNDDVEAHLFDGLSKQWARRTTGTFLPLQQQVKLFTGNYKASSPRPSTTTTVNLASGVSFSKNGAADLYYLIRTTFSDEKPAYVFISSLKFNSNSKQHIATDFTINYESDTSFKVSSYASSGVAVEEIYAVKLGLSVINKGVKVRRWLADHENTDHVYNPDPKANVAGTNIPLNNAFVYNEISGTSTPNTGTLEMGDRKSRTNFPYTQGSKMYNDSTGLGVTKSITLENALGHHYSELDFLLVYLNPTAAEGVLVPLHKIENDGDYYENTYTYQDDKYIGTFVLGILREGDKVLKLVKNTNGNSNNHNIKRIIKLNLGTAYSNFYATTPAAYQSLKDGQTITDFHELDNTDNFQLIEKAVKHVDTPSISSLDFVKSDLITISVNNQYDKGYIYQYSGTNKVALSSGTFSVNDWNDTSKFIDIGQFPDDSSLELNDNKLRVKDGGITIDKVSDDLRISRGSFSNGLGNNINIATDIALRSDSSDFVVDILGESQFDGLFKLTIKGRWEASGFLSNYKWCTATMDKKRTYIAQEIVPPSSSSTTVPNTIVLVNDGAKLNIRVYRMFRGYVSILAKARLFHHGTLGNNLITSISTTQSFSGTPTHTHGINPEIELNTLDVESTIDLSDKFPLKGGNALKFGKGLKVHTNGYIEAAPKAAMVFTGDVTFRSSDHRFSGYKGVFVKNLTKPTVDTFKLYGAFGNDLFSIIVTTNRDNLNLIRTTFPVPGSNYLTLKFDDAFKDKDIVYITIYKMEVTRTVRSSVTGANDMLS